MDDLTKNQRLMVQYSKYNCLGNNHYCEDLGGHDQRTIAALVRKGYAQKPIVAGARAFLTKKGEAAREALTAPTPLSCAGCGAERRSINSACHICGEVAQ